MASRPTMGKADLVQQSSKGFEKNLGQIQGKDKNLVNYFYTSGDLTVFITKKGLTYQFDRWENMNQESDKKMNYKHESYRMDMELSGANYSAQIIEEDPLNSYTNYYNFDIHNVNSYKKITYKNIYPNIDWVIYFSTSGAKKEEF
jgi:hypothetical protein